MTDLPLDPLATFRLDGKVVLLTGASSGLGQRFARVLDAAGARLLLVARRRERLESLAAELHSARIAVCDVADTAAAAGLVGETVRAFGRIDIVVNNAGINDVGPAIDERVERFQEVLAVNLVAPFVIAREAARAMIDAGTGGVVVNVASILGLVGLGRIPEAGYAASKGGLVTMTRELAAQWARKGVRVNALAPGWFRSELTADLFGTESGVEFVRRTAPMGRGGEEHELDGALLFLASPASSYVTGHVLIVDGGWTAV